MELLNVSLTPLSVQSAASSKRKSNRSFIIASVIASIFGFLSPLVIFNLIGISVAAFAIYRSHRGKAGWAALVLGIMLYLVKMWATFY